MRDKLKRQQLNNQGFSLVELIVVILATAVVVAFVNSEDQKTKSSATLVSKYLDNVMNYSMTKGNAYLTLEYDDDSGRYYVKDSENHSEKLSPAIEVSYHIENCENVIVIGDKETVIDENGDEVVANDGKNDKLMLSFSRTNGSFTPIIKSVNADGTFVYETTGDSNANVYADSITIKCNDSTKVIHLYTKTGVYEIE